MSDALADHLIIKVYAGINLAPKDITGTSDSYVVAQLEDLKGHKGKKKKSQIITSLNPVWNWECEAIPMFRIKDYLKLHFQVFDKDFGSKDDFMGECTLLLSDLIVKAESIKEGKKKAQEGIIHLQLSPKPIIPGLKNKVELVSGEIVIQYTFPPFKFVREASENSLLKLTTVTGREVFKVSASGSVGVQSFFELPPFMYDVQGFSINNAMWFANLSQLAYKVPHVVLETAPALFKMEHCEFFEDKDLDSQGFGMYNDRATFICFRGTESASDCAINIVFIPIPPFSDYPEINVHAGFSAAFTSLMDQVDQFVAASYEKYPNNQLYLSGHSLGGALAQVCLMHFLFGPQEKRRKVHKIYTIGQPIVCNSEGRKLLETHHSDVEYFRITNRLDFIPSLGLGTHCGAHVHIGSDGKIDFKKESISALSTLKRGSTMLAKGVGGCMTDHSSASYFKWLEKNWIKHEMCKLSSVASEYNLLNSVLYLVDKISEEIKLVRKHKSFLRVLVQELGEVRYIANGLMDHLADISPKILRIADSHVVYLSNLLYKIYSYLSKHSLMKNITAGKTSKKLNALGAKIKQTCAELKHLVTILHSLKPSNTTEESTKSTLNQTSYFVNTTDITREVIFESEVVEDQSRVRDSLAKNAVFIEFYHNQQFNEAIQYFKDNLYSENDPDFSDNLLILAQCAIELADFPAAFFYLGEIVNNQTSLIDEIAFTTNSFSKLKSNPIHKAALDTVLSTISKRNIELSRYKGILTENEIQSLTEFFCEADTNGDTFLSFEEISTFVEKFGVRYVLEALAWAVPTTLDERWEQYKAIVQGLKVVSVDQFLNSFATLKSDVSGGK